jgi:DNA-binding transcriptional ArsR family regulator
MEHMSDKLQEFKSEFFKALASPLRIKILDELREGELSVSDLASRLNVEQANVSQQLAVLRAKNIVIGRKQANNIYYRCTDPTIFRLLDAAKEIFNNHLVGVKDMLETL